MWRNDEERTSRRCTDKYLLVANVVVVLIMITFVYFAVKEGSTDRLLKGYDDCGNICGLINAGNHFDACGSHDKRNLSKLLVEEDKHKVTSYTCVNRCPQNYSEIFNRCWKESSKFSFRNSIQGITHDLMVSKIKIFLLCVVAFILSFALLILFRHGIEYVIFVICGSFIAAMVIGAAVFASSSKSLAICLLVLAAVTAFVLFWYRKRIRLTIELFREAARALIDVPTVLFEPITTFITLLIAIIPFIYVTLIMQTAGDLKQVSVHGKPKVKLEKNAVVYIAEILNYLTFYWFTQFVFGCQHFVVSGTVSRWYFSKDKANLNSPLLRSFSDLLFYHLGSICLGSIFITAVKVVKMFVDGMKNAIERQENLVSRFLGCFCTCIVDAIEQLLRFLTRNAYIIVAKDGTPFFTSAKRAYELLTRDIIDVIILNRFGDIVLVLARFLITGVTGFIGYLIMKEPHLNHISVPVIVCIIFSFLISHCFVSVFEMTIDTIFICFSEDCELNDGISRPYCMSERLKNIMCDLKQESGGRFENFRGSHDERKQLLEDRENPHSSYDMI